MYEMRISVFAYELLKELNQSEELQAMLKEFTTKSGTNIHLDYHWAHINDNDLLIAQLKYPNVFKYVAARTIQ